MKPQYAYQEVLIFTNTTLSLKALCKNNSSNKNSSVVEQLEEAFWNGLLNELLPEIRSSILDPKMVIWGVHTGKFYLLIDLAVCPGVTDSVFSIDPHLLLTEINVN